MFVSLSSCFYTACESGEICRKTDMSCQKCTIFFQNVSHKWWIWAHWCALHICKKAFLVSTRQNLKFKFFFWGHGPQTFTRMWPWTPLGTSVPKTPWNPEPVQPLKPSYTPEHSTECCLKLHAGFKMCLYVIVATAAAPCGCLEVAGCCCWYRYFKQI